MPPEAYYSAITRKLVGMTNLTHREAFKKAFLYARVEDSYTSKGMTLGWMTCVQYMFNCIKKHNPALVFFDQISNAMLDIGYTKKEKIPDYQKMVIISSDIKNRINDTTLDIPPIIVFQQMMPPKEAKPSQWHLKTLLRDSKNTLNDATHSLIIVRRIGANDQQMTVLKIDKVRYEYSYGKIVTFWEMDNNWVLRKSDVGDD